MAFTLFTFQEGRLKRDAKLDKSDDDQTDVGAKDEEIHQEKVVSPEMG